MTDEFSVHWWDTAGNYHRELAYVDAEAAVRAAKRLTTGPASSFAVQRVIITDGADFACFEWKDGRITYDGRELQ